MKKVELIRNPHQVEQTTGSWTVFDEDCSEVFKCVTMELPNKGNQRSISCIPEGDYLVKMTYSPKYKRQMYLITNVVNRSGVRIHSGNFWYNLKGCISLGKDYYDINGDGLPDVTASRNTVKAFEQVMNGDEFMLEIATAKVFA